MNSNLTSSPPFISGTASHAIYAAPAKHPKAKFLDGLPRQVRNSVLAAATHRRLCARSVVINQSDPADYLFLLLEGCARHFFMTPQGEKLLLFWLSPGDIFGGRALLSRPSTYLINTEMVKDSSVAVWHRDTIRKLAADNPTLFDNALEIASDYFAWYVATHCVLVSHTARQRLAHVLTSLSACIGRQVAGGVELDLSNEELASAANLTPFTTSRLLSGWQRRGAIAKRRGKVLLLKPDLLFHALN